MDTSFDGLQSRASGSNTIGRVVRSILGQIDSPRALAVWLLHSHGEHGQLCDLVCQPSHYTNPSRFRDDYLVTEFLKKYEDLSGFEPLKKAMKTDSESEQRCLETNLRFKALFTRNGGSTPLIESILLIAKRKIARVLGPFTWDCLADCRWGPGNTSLSKGAFTSAYNKFTEQTVDVSSSALEILKAYIQTSPVWSGTFLGVKPEAPFCLTTNCFNVVEHNHLTFVPKNAKTHRSICVEPHGNTWLQLGVGKFIRRRLRSRAGIDLNDQSINQDLARQGSIDGELVTIDLSAASDSIASSLVEYLLPFDWFLVVDRLRVHKTEMPDGSIRKNEKFSSMGNGFTFELESLIFWALASSAREVAGIHDSPLSVYGDDIIVHRDVEPLLKEALLFCGFVYNDSKSFVTGPFRESCGTDWFNGVNVRPFFIKEVPSSVPDFIELANKIRLYSWAGSYGCDKRFKKAYYHVVKELPHSTPRVPLHDRTGGLISDPSESGAITRLRHGWQGWSYRRLQVVPGKRRMRRYYPALAATLSGSTILQSLGLFDLRGVVKLKVNKGQTCVWPALGPWL